MLAGHVGCGAGNGLLVSSVVAIRTNLLTQNLEWMGQGWDLTGMWL